MRAAERINAEVWSSRKVLGVFAARDGYIDPGEELLLPRLAAAAAGRPILDIGVGAGRTIPLLAPAGDGYVAVDYLPEMVELSRSLHPGVRVEQADARDLSGFADESFGAVFFSYNGIDGIAHEDRAAVHRAAMRVLEPGGTYLYSTHNLDYCAAGLPPWHRLNLDLDNGPRAMLSCAARMPERARSYHRLRPLTLHGEGWAILVGSGYDYSVLWHHVTPAEAAAELERAGFVSPAEVFDATGRPVQPGPADTENSPWLYLLACKPDAAAPG
jgi:SAM-dependent methyltransferase